MAKIMSHPPYTDGAVTAEYEDIVKRFLGIGYAGEFVYEIGAKVVMCLHFH